MPYYTELALKSKSNTAEILYNIGNTFNPSNAKNPVRIDNIPLDDTKQKEDPAELVNQLISKYKSSQVISLGVAPLNQNLSMSTSIQWTGMGSMADSLLRGFTDTLAGNRMIITQGLAALTSTADNIFGDSSAGDKIRNLINKFNRNSTIFNQFNLSFITNMGYTKSYTGSFSNIDLQPLEIILYAKSSNDNIINKLKRILYLLSPLDKSTKIINSDEKINNFDLFLRVEQSPGNYYSASNTFNIYYELMNYYIVRLGHKYVPFCLPTNINIMMSRSGYMHSRTWMPHYIRLTVTMTPAYRVLTKNMIYVLEDRFDADTWKCKAPPNNKNAANSTQTAVQATTQTATNSSQAVASTMIQR